MGISIEEYKMLIQKDTQKNAMRQLQGKVNRSLGQNFEKQIETICEFYKLNKLAIVEKTPEPMKILKHIDNGHFETVFEKSAQPDFKGIIKGGRTVVFDAKFTEKDRITYQALSDFQREELQNYNDLGAMAFVLAGFPNGNMYKIDISIWSDMKNIFGRKYIKQTELDEMKLIANKSKNGVIDFLQIM